MTIDERIEELEKLQNDIVRDIMALAGLRAGMWTAPRPGDECGPWRVGDEYQLIHAPTGAEFTAYCPDQARCVLQHIRERDVEALIFDWLRAVSAGYHLTLETDDT